MSDYEKYMQVCLDLAVKGLGQTASNPMVGAVLVFEDQIIGEGFHQKYGEAHAEVNCIRSVSEKDQDKIASSTLYISLEPCYHTGKTPPCVDLILEKGIQKVVIACSDPNPLVAGKSVEKLKQSGVHVVEDVLKAEARELNKRFFTFHEKKRPYIILKHAISDQGYFCRKDKQKQWLSSAESNALVHQWRSEEMAILVGKNTVIMDDPALTVRLVEGNNPIRIVLDKNLELIRSYRIFEPTATLIVCNNLIEKVEENTIYVKANTIQEIVAKLYQLHIASMIVEGGLQTIEEFIAANMYDEIREIHTSTCIEEGISAPAIDIIADRQQAISTDIIYYYRNRNSL